jgi:hypothetical protein
MKINNNLFIIVLNNVMFVQNLAGDLLRMNLEGALVLK